MTHLLSSLARGRVAVLLEGGYNLESISHSMTLCTKALLGDPLPSPQLKPIDPAGLSTIQRVVHHQRKHWSSLRFHVDLPDAEDIVRPTLKEEKKDVPLEDQMEQLRLEWSAETEALEASKCAEAAAAVVKLELDSSSVVDGAENPSGTDEPKTLQEFLLLPENIEVYSVPKK